MRPRRSDVLKVINHFNNTSLCSAHRVGHSACSHTPKYSSQAKEQTFDYAFEFKSSNLRFGRGVTREVGADLENMGAKKVGVITDPQMASLPPVLQALESLRSHNLEFDVYDQVRCEPTDSSFADAIKFAQNSNADAFLAVGGGSVLDTAKAANLFCKHRDYELFDFVNAPVGKGLPIPSPLFPLVAIPTTTGTGSETTGVAVFDIESMQCKTGIANRLLTPNLALVDPNHAQYQPSGILASSGFDVLCHALESYTALSYDERSPLPTNPKFRPAYQGSNPISDVWCGVALPMLCKYFVRACENMDDYEAREAMQFAACFAGMGFGTAGVHLCHGMSYPISGLNKSVGKYVYRDYEYLEHSIIPHGVSVVVSAPSVFEFTVTAKPERHRQGAIWLGMDENNIKMTDVDDISRKLRDVLIGYMERLKVPMGLKKVGFGMEHVDMLVDGALPQKRLTNISPNPVDRDVLAKLFENAMEY